MSSNRTLHLYRCALLSLACGSSFVAACGDEAALPVVATAAEVTADDLPDNTAPDEGPDATDTATEQLETTPDIPMDVPETMLELPETTATTATLPFSDGGLTITALLVPSGPSASDAVLIDRVRVFFAQHYAADIPRITATDAAPPAGALLLGNAHTNAGLAYLARAHEALVDLSFPGPGGFVLERHPTYLVLGVNDVAGVDLAIDRLDTLQTRGVFATTYGTPAVVIADPKLLDSESDAFASKIYVDQHPRDMWFAERLRDIATLLAGQRFDETPSSYGALMPQWTVDGQPGSSGCQNEVHGRAIEGISAIAWAYASAFEPLTDSTLGTITINPYTNHPALPVRVAAAMLFADRHLRLPDGRFARIAGGPGCDHYDTDTASVAFIGMEMLFAYHVLAPALDTFTRDWFRDLLMTSMSQAVSLGSEFSDAFVNQDLALSYAVALYGHTLGETTIVRKAQPVALDTYLATRSERIAANRSELGFFSEVNDFDVGYDLVSQQQLAFYLTLRPDDAVLAAAFGDHMQYSALVYPPLRVDGILRHVNGYWTSPRHPERTGGVFDGYAALGFHWTHLLASAFTPLAQELFTTYDDPAIADPIFRTTINATASLASQTAEQRYGMQTGWFQPLYFKTFMEPKTRALPEFGKHVGQYPMVDPEPFIRRDRDVAFSAVNRPKYYTYSLRGVPGIYWWGLDTETVAFSASQQNRHFGTYVNGVAMTYGTSVFVAANGADPAREEFELDGRRRVQTYADDRMEVEVVVQNGMGTSIPLVEQIPFLRVSSDGGAVAIGAPEATADGVRVWIGPAGHRVALNVSGVTTDAISVEALSADSVPVLATYKSALKANATLLRVAFGSIPPGGTKSLRYSLVPE